MNPVNGSINGPNQVQPLQPGQSQPTRPAPRTGGNSFGQIFESELQKQEEVKFSLHAQDRLRMRGIPMSPQEMQRLSEGVNRVAEKGGRESLVLMDNSAFVVSVPNRTVITAMDGESMKQNVFTNIDSAIIV